MAGGRGREDESVGAPRAAADHTATRAVKPAKKRRPARRRGWLTREGKAFVFVTVGVGMAAVNTGNNLLYLMLGLMLSILLLSMVLSEVALARIRVRRRLPDRAFAGTTCLVEITLENAKKRVPSFSLEVEDRAEGEPTERRCYFLKVGPRSEQVAAYRRAPQRRGLLQLSGFHLGTRYPFGLVEKTRLVDAPQELLVYPKLHPVDALALHTLVDGADHAAGRPGPGTEIAGIRGYHTGDEARTIHWRRTASLGRLVVRERERDAAGRLTLVVDNARPEGAGGEWAERFELAVSRAASLASLALTRQVAVEVVARGSRSPVALAGTPPDPIWRFLALLEPIASAGAPPLAGSSGAHVVEVMQELSPSMEGAA